MPGILNNQRLVYLLQCARCGRQYVGQTVNTLADRATKHLQEVRRGGSSKLQLHYNGEGHTPHDMRFQPLAKVGDDLTPSEAETQLKKLETMWIRRLGTMQPIGLNYVLEDTRQSIGVGTGGAEGAIAPAAAIKGGRTYHFAPPLLAGVNFFTMLSIVACGANYTALCGHTFCGQKAYL